MSIQLFQIFLDKPEEDYYAGEQLTGKFVITVTDGYNHNGIFLKFEGHGMIKWREESSCCEDIVVKQCIARKQYFDTMFKYASENELAEGTHVFPFEYSLPKTLPSSYATLTTSVWYKMEALIKKDPNKPRREVKIFSIKGILDLNDFPELRVPMSKVKSKTLTGFLPPCFCRFHYVSIGLKLLNRGFVPRDKIPCELSVYTVTMPLTNVTLTLVQETTMSTREKTMVERRTVSKLILPDIASELSQDYRRWEKKISVPEDILITSEVKEYETIKIQSFVKFSGEAVNFPYKIVHVSIPVVIGTVPLTKLVDESEGDYTDEFGDKESGGLIIPRIVIDSSELFKKAVEEIALAVVAESEDDSPQPLYSTTEPGDPGVDESDVDTSLWGLESTGVEVEGHGSLARGGRSPQSERAFGTVDFSRFSVGNETATM